MSDDLLRARDLLAAAELLERDAAAWDNVLVSSLAFKADGGAAAAANRADRKAHRVTDVTEDVTGRVTDVTDVTDEEEGHPASQALGRGQAKPGAEIEAPVSRASALAAMAREAHAGAGGAGGSEGAVV